VQRGSARRQSSADRAHGCRAQAPHVRHAVKIGFKEIEVGFPAASQTDYDFVREIIERRLIPDDVTIQVLTQARSRIDCAHLRGAKGRAARDRACLQLHLGAQRRVVFRMDRAGIVDIAVRGAAACASMRCAPGHRMGVSIQPRELHGHRARFCGRDLRCGQCGLGADPEEQARFSILPATVEMATPNVYADQIEWFCGTSASATR
jgi:2-isopropylmalate synthase